VSVLHFEGHGTHIGELLVEHEVLHQKVAAFDAADQEHTGEEEDQLSTDIRDNISALLDLIGLPGLRGLIHVAHEALDEACHRGLRLTSDGDFVDPDDGQAWMDILADINEIEKLLVVTSQHGGRLPADHGEPDGTNLFVPGL
jgi:hypothetical protein